jgi:hypothetical protein
MKYLITETQQKKLEELTTAGSWGKTDVDEKIFHAVYDKLGTRIAKLIREFLTDVMGKDVSNISDIDLIDYFETRGLWSKGFPKYFKSPDTISGLNYYLAQKVFKLKKGNHELDYFTIKMYGEIQYYFFDSELELSIGYMSIRPFDPSYLHYVYALLPSKTFKVSLSMIDDKLIGMGYGKKMYLTVIDTVKCLVSDELLYKGSLNMWVNVIPKYVSYSGYITADKKVIKLPTNKRLRYDDIDCFFASNSVDIFSKYNKSI